MWSGLNPGSKVAPEIQPVGVEPCCVQRQGQTLEFAFKLGLGLLRFSLRFSEALSELGKISFHHQTVCGKNPSADLLAGNSLGWEADACWIVSWLTQKVCNLWGFIKKPGGQRSSLKSQIPPMRPISAVDLHLTLSSQMKNCRLNVTMCT